MTPVERAARMLFTMLLALLMLGCGAMSLCGGWVTMMAASTLWLISVPSLLFGAYGAWRTWQRIRSVWPSQQDEAPHEPAP